MNRHQAARNKPLLCQRCRTKDATHSVLSKLLLCDSCFAYFTSLDEVVTLIGQRELATVPSRFKKLDQEVDRRINEIIQAAMSQEK